MNHARIVAVLVAFVLSLSADMLGNTPNPVPYINQPPSPISVPAGGSGFVLTVHGAGFVSGSVVQWNGAARATTFVSTSQLTASITASDLANPMTAEITVASPAPGGGVSNVVLFQVNDPTSSVAYSASQLSTGLGPSISVVKTASGDFNGDAKQDIVTLNSDSSISVLLGNGDGTFQAAANYAALSSSGSPVPEAVLVGDFNGDGKLDVAISQAITTTTRVVVYLGNGDGTFQAPSAGFTDSANGTTGTTFVEGDLNGDGKLDLVVDCQNATQGGLCVWPGNGDGTFNAGTNVVNAQMQSAHAALADLNGDGKLDVAVTFLDTLGNSIVATGLGNGDGTFSSLSIVDTIPLPTGNFNASLVIADFDGNGIADLAYYFQSCNAPSACTGNLQTYSGNGDGTFQSALPSLGAPVGNSDLILGDFNGDGIEDLAVLNTVLLGRGDGTFAVNSSTLGQTAILTADFNRDGFLDFIGQSAQGYLSLLSRIPPDFTGFSSPTAETVIAGTNTSYSVQVIPVNGWLKDVTLSVTGLPAGLTASFQPAVVTQGNGISLLSINSSASTVPGTYALTLSGTSGSNVHSTTITITVNPASADFGGDILPASQLVAGGQQANYSVQVVPFNGFSGDVTLSVSGLPAGSYASFNPAVIQGGSGSSVLTVVAPVSAQSGLYVLTITGTSGGVSHSGKRELFINTNADFTGSVTTAVGSVLPGQRASYVANVVSLNGFTGTVALSVSGLPAGAIARFTPASVMGGSGSSSLIVTTSSATPPGAYTLTIAGESGSDSKSTTVSLLVNTSTGDFVGYINPSSQSVVAGSGATYIVGVSPLSGFTGNVTISVSGLPPGSIASFAPSNLISGGSGAVNVTITTGSATPVGTYTVVFTGTSGGLSHAGAVTLTVN